MDPYRQQDKDWGGSKSQNERSDGESGLNGGASTEMIVVVDAHLHGKPMSCGHDTQ